jgi:hypothetical protein
MYVPDCLLPSLRSYRKQGFERWSELAGSQTAALLDVFPILRYLPDAFLPMKRYAKGLHMKEYDLYVGHYLTAKRKLKEGKAKVRISYHPLLNSSEALLTI